MKPIGLLLLSISAAVIPIAVRAQQQASGIVISGHVLRLNGDPIKKAAVTLQSNTSQPTAAAGRGGRGQAAPVAAPQQDANSTASRSLITDDNGGFSFTDIPPGSYRVRAERDGFMPAEYGQRSLAGQGFPVTVQNGQKLASIDFKLVQAGTISGRIRDEDGLPVPGIQVQALGFEYRQGQRILLPNIQGQTNDLGEYRLYWFQPGTYYVSAVPIAAGARGAGGARGNTNIPGPPIASQADTSYAPIYYFPDGTDPLRAIPIEVAAAADVRGIDFSIRPLKTGRVTGVVLPAAVGPPPSLQQQLQAQQQRQQQAPNPQGRGNRGGPAGGVAAGQNLGGFEVVLLPMGMPTVTGGQGRGASARSTVQSNGTFEIVHVVPGTYNVAAFAEQNGTDYTAFAPVTVRDGGTSSVTLSLKPSVDFPGRISVDGLQVAPVSNAPQGGQNQPFQMTGVQIRLIPTDDFPGAGQENSNAKDDGTFLVDNIRALHYRVQVQMPAGAYLISGTYGGVDALNGIIEVLDSETPLELRMGLTPGRIEGTVTDRVGQPYSGATVTLVPSVPTRLDLYRNVTSDGNGRFTIASQAPGDYKIFAWEQIAQGAWQDSSYLEKFQDRGRILHLAKSGSASESLTVIPATGP